MSRIDMMIERKNSKQSNTEITNTSMQIMYNTETLFEIRILRSLYDAFQIIRERESDDDLVAGMGLGLT